MSCHFHGSNAFDFRAFSQKNPLRMSVFKIITFLTRSRSAFMPRAFPGNPDGCLQTDL